MITRSEVSEAVKRLKEAHRVGGQIRRGQRFPAHQGRPTIEIVAAGMGLNADNYRKRRLFADPDVGYTKQELEQLCQLCKRYQRPLSFTVVVRLMKVRNKKERSKLQRQAVEAGWSVADIDAELARLHGRRRWAGRKPKMPHNVDEALVQLDSLCLKWRRWHAQMAAQPQGDTSTVTIADLPEAVRKSLLKATHAVRQAEKAIADYSTRSWASPTDR